MSHENSVDNHFCYTACKHQLLSLSCRVHSPHRCSKSLEKTKTFNYKLLKDILFNPNKHTPILLCDIVCINNDIKNRKTFSDHFTNFKTKEICWALTDDLKIFNNYSWGLWQPLAFYGWETLFHVVWYIIKYTLLESESVCMYIFHHLYYCLELEDIWVENEKRCTYLLLLVSLSHMYTHRAHLSYLVKSVLRNILQNNRFHSLYICKPCLWDV